MKIRSLTSAAALTLLTSATALACGGGQYAPARYATPAYYSGPRSHVNHWAPHYRAPAPPAPQHQQVPELPPPAPTVSGPETLPELSLNQLKGNEQIKFQNGLLFVFDANGEFIGILR